MAKAAAKRNVKRNKSAKSKVAPFNIYWEKTNYLILFAGIAVLILGYFFMSMGPWNSFASLDVSPVILIIGYVIVLPLAILYRKRNGGSSSEPDAQTPDKK